MDRGWHVSPAYSGDEHNGRWGNVGPYVTGLWAEELTREGIYEAIRNRRTYSSADRNFELVYSANGYVMGSILPADTEQLDIHIKLRDPDSADLIDKIYIYTNGGQIVKQYAGINNNETVIEDAISASQGDYYFLRVYQNDGDEIISAPIWIGDVTRGTDFAPEITIHGLIAENASINDVITIPSASAADDSGEIPSVNVHVFNSKGEVQIQNNQFAIEEYGDYFVRFSASDSAGNTRVQLKRIRVNSEPLDAQKIFGEFEPIVNVGETENQVGVNLVTDQILQEAYVQYKPIYENWDHARIAKANTSYFEAAYGGSIEESHFRTLAAHEAVLSDLNAGEVYEYRYGISEQGPWGDAFRFETAAQNMDTVIYVLGDLEITTKWPDDFERFNQMLSVLKEKNENGRLMIQLGNFVSNASNIRSWNDRFEHMISRWDLISAYVLGEFEPYTRKERIGTFTGFFNLPKNGESAHHLLETNYSFDYGNVHVAVINTSGNFEEQLLWLEQDMQASSKKWKVVFGHQPYYGGMSSDQPELDAYRTKLSNVLQRLGVQLYIGGQDRVYKRTTIRDKIKTDEIDSGVTFITAGTAGPHFYENKQFAWDHVVYDEKVQTGIILEASEAGLTVKAYNLHGDEIDRFTIQPTVNISNIHKTSSQFQGIGLMNNISSLQSVAVVGEKYDYTGEILLESRIKEAVLGQLGQEETIWFDQPLDFNDEHTVKVSVYDNMTDKNLLVPVTIVKEGIGGDGSAQNPFKIRGIAGLNHIHKHPDKHFVLEQDIAGNGEMFTAIGANGVPFTGTLDGNGHVISGLVITSGGAGIFAENEGVIKNLGIVDAHVDADRDNVGLLVDLNNGTVENAYSTGSISGNATVGGLIGFSNGVVRNSYSLANVTARKRQAGGVIGITNAGSLTENVYGAGIVRSLDSNAGGVSGYGYNNTVIRNVIALNPTVTSPLGGVTNRVLGRVLLNHQAELENNYAYADMFVIGNGDPNEDVSSLQGQGISKTEIESMSTFVDLLGWDFDVVWKWDHENKRPVLKFQ